MNVVTYGAVFDADMGANDGMVPDYDIFADVGVCSDACVCLYSDVFFNDNARSNVARWVDLGAGMNVCAGVNAARSRVCAPGI
jgi:hypothetical protein